MRVMAECGIGSLYECFSVLDDMPSWDAAYIVIVLDVCARLFNIRTRKDRINQIKTVCLHDLSLPSN